MILYLRHAIISASCLAVWAIAGSAIAQIVPDSSLPTNSQVTSNNNTTTIGGGTTAGANLFHSFSQFSVPMGTEAFFNNSLSIENILSRVTGGSISNIDGLIRANGSANLFLLNPNGIVLGPSARLDIGGSFVGTTANSIIFEDGLEFRTNPVGEQPLLTVNLPIGLQLGQQGGEIAVVGPGHRLQISLISPTNRSLTPSGLAVAEGRTLSLIGNNITANGGQIGTAGGLVELAGVQQGRVFFSLADSTFAYDRVTEFGDLFLDNLSLIDVSGANSGSIGLQGRNITLENGSAILSQNLAGDPGGLVEIRATENLRSGEGGLGGVILSETLGPGQGSDAIVSAPNIVFRNGGAIASRTFGSGNSGNLLIQSEDITLTGASPLDLQIQSGFLTATFGAGNASNVRIDTARLMLAEGSTINSTSFGVGDGGNLDIVASQSIEIAGKNQISIAPTSIGSTTFNRGNVGSTLIQTERLVVLSGATLGSATFATGNTGTTNINATSIEVNGVGIDGEASLIASSAVLLPVLLQQLFGLPAQPSGRAGALIIDTETLTVRDGGRVGVFHDGTGDAGDLSLRADNVSLDSDGSITAETVSGQGGNLVLGTGNLLLLRDASQITVEAGGTGDGGNLNLDSGIIALLDSSRITANAFQGNGGKISIATSGIFSSVNSSITASSQFGVDGLISITNPEVDSTTGLVELTKNPVDASDKIITGCAAAQGNSFTVVGRGGLPPNPEEQIIGDRSWADLRDLSAFRGETAYEFPAPKTSEAIVEANSWRVNEFGEVELVAVLEVGNGAGQSLSASCSEAQMGLFRAEEVSED